MVLFLGRIPKPCIRAEYHSSATGQIYLLHTSAKIPWLWRQNTKTLNLRTIWLWTWVKYHGSVPGQNVSISLYQGNMPWFPARAKHGSVSEQNTYLRTWAKYTLHLDKIPPVP
jgi:hypothetical protein